MATEAVTPLSLRLMALSTEPGWRLWAIHRLFQALAFLHGEAGLLHGNVRLPALLVTRAGELRLGGFELASQVRKRGHSGGDEASPLSDRVLVFRRSEEGDWPPEVSSPYAALPWVQLRE